MTTGPARVGQRKMLVFDSAYTHRILTERNLAPIVTGRDLGGYFDHIWTVHPVAGLLEPAGSGNRFGPPQVRALAPGHTHIEGKVARFDWPRWLAPLNFLIAQIELLWLVRRVVLREGIRLVRAEDPLYNGLLALLFRRKHKRALLIGVWGNPGELRRNTGQPIMPRFSRKIWIEEAIERFVLRRADLAMAQNADNRTFLLAHGVRPERTIIFRLGNLLHKAHFVDPAARGDGRADLRELGVDNAETLVCISRLEILKMVDHVVRVVAELKSRGRAVYALLVGDGAERAPLAALALELGVEDRVLLCGNRDQEWLARILPRVSAVLSPLTGRALGEAALGGRPIVAYDVDWHSELVETGITGELVPYRDWRAMADATERLLADPPYADRCGEAVRQRAFEMLDPARADEAQIAAYEDLLAKLDP